MLEDSQKNINAFIYLIKNQPDLFLNKNRHEDLKEASPNFGETEDQLSDEIIKWCAKYTDIQQALRQTRKELSSAETQSIKDRLPGTTKPITPPPPPPPKVSRETLLNAIQESFPNQ